MPTTEDVLAVARREVGYREGANNANKYGAAYGVNNVAWCMQFVWWVFREAGASGLIHEKTAYTPTAYDWHRSRGQASTTPRVGSLVFFNWPDSLNRIQHVGIVEAVETNAIVTLEGNTQSGTAGNQSDGGGVYRRRRARNSSIVGYGHPAYSNTPGGAVARILKLTDPWMRGDDVAAVQRSLRIAADGVFGPDTDRAVRVFQASRGLDVDGQVGPLTLAALNPAQPTATPAPPAPVPAPAPSAEVGGWAELVPDYYTADSDDRMRASECLAWGTTHAAHARDAAREALAKATTLESKVDALLARVVSGGAAQPGVGSLTDADVARIRDAVVPAVLNELSKRTAA